MSTRVIIENVVDMLRRERDVAIDEVEALFAENERLRAPPTEAEVEAAAHSVYQRMFPLVEQSTIDDHFEWHRQYSGDPDSVHYSNVEHAWRYARAALEAVREKK